MFRLSATNDSFSGACGQSSPLRLAVEHTEAGRIAEGELNQPYALIGSASVCEITLNHPDVPERLALLQVVEGSVFVLELSSLRLCRLSPSMPYVVGPFRVQLLGWLADGETAGLSDPLRDRLPAYFPRVRLIGDTILVVDHRITFLNAGNANSDLPLAYLTLTAEGLYVTDLLSGEGVLVNGELVRHSALTNEDELQVAGTHYTVAVTPPAPNRDASLTPRRLSEALLGGSWFEPEDSPLGSLVPTPAEEVSYPIHPESEATRVATRPGGVQRYFIDRVRQKLDALLADFGNLRREQLVALRDELAELAEHGDRLTNGSINVPIPELAPVPLVVPPTPADATSTVNEETAAAHLAVFERLATLDRERSSLWGRLRGMLGSRN